MSLTEDGKHMFETVQKLQGSQAEQMNANIITKFETVQKLQGSQANSLMISV